MTVVGNEENMPISKADLMYFYKLRTGNPYLIRLAETLADDISTFAELNGLEGDLSK